MKTRMRISMALLGAWAAISPALRAQSGASEQLKSQLQHAEQRLENALQKVPVLERRIQDREQLKDAFKLYYGQLQPKKEIFKKAYEQYVVYLELVMSEGGIGRDSSIAADKRRVDPRKRDVKSRWGGWLGVFPDWYKYGPYGKEYVAAEDELEARRRDYYESKDRVNEEIRTGFGIGVGELAPPRDYDGLAALAKDQEGVLTGLTQELQRLSETEIPGLRAEIANLRDQLQDAERQERERAAGQDQPVRNQQEDATGQEKPDNAGSGIMYEGPMSEEFQQKMHELFAQAAQSGLTVTRENISFSPMRMRVMPRARQATPEPVSANLGVGARSDNPAFKIESGELDLAATLAFSPGAIHEDGSITGTYTAQFEKHGTGAMAPQSGEGSIGLLWRAVPDGSLTIESEGMQLPTTYLVYLGSDPTAPPMFRLQCRGTQLNTFPAP
jgi:hypothetical protein